MLLLAGAGGAQYMGAVGHGPAVPTWTAEFPVAAFGGPGGSGTAQDGQPATATISFNQTNITRVTFLFTFTDLYRFALLSPAGANFKVTSPLDVSAEASVTPGQSTTATITVREVCRVPGALDFPAPTSDDAVRVMLAANPPNSNGTGDWTVEVTVSRDYLTPAHGTGSISWTAVTRVESYALELSEKLSG